MSKQKSKAFDGLKKIIEGKESKERTLLANALLMERIKRKPLTFEKCQAILELLEGENISKV